MDWAGKIVSQHSIEGACVHHKAFGRSVLLELCPYSSAFRSIALRREKTVLAPPWMRFERRLATARLLLASVPLPPDSIINIRKA
jgi:hypothetical protein